MRNSYVILPLGPDAMGLRIDSEKNLSKDFRPFTPIISG
jgi:hypothetical protein